MPLILAGDALSLGEVLVEISLAWYFFAGRGRATPSSGIVERGFGNNGDRLGFGRQGMLGAYKCGGLGNARWQG